MSSTKTRCIAVFLAVIVRIPAVRVYAALRRHYADRLRRAWTLPLAHPGLGACQEDGQSRRAGRFPAWRER
jgi:hypothetical protein